MISWCGYYESLIVKLTQFETGRLFCRIRLYLYRSTYIAKDRPESVVFVQSNKIHASKSTSKLWTNPICFLVQHYQMNHYFPLERTENLVPNKSIEKWSYPAKVFHLCVPLSPSASVRIQIGSIKSNVPKRDPRQ